MNSCYCQNCGSMLEKIVCTICKYVNVQYDEPALIRAKRCQNCRLLTNCTYNYCDACGEEFEGGKNRRLQLLQENQMLMVKCFADDIFTEENLAIIEEDICKEEQRCTFYTDQNAQCCCVTCIERVMQLFDGEKSEISRDETDAIVISSSEEKLSPSKYSQFSRMNISESGSSTSSEISVHVSEPFPTQQWLDMFEEPEQGTHPLLIGELLINF